MTKWSDARFVPGRELSVFCCVFYDGECSSNHLQAWGSLFLLSIFLEGNYWSKGRDIIMGVAVCCHVTFQKHYNHLQLSAVGEIAF